MRILIAENDANLRSRLLETAAECGIEADIAIDCRSALYALACNKYDWVCLSGHYNDGTGLEILKVITKHYGETKTFIVTNQAANILFNREAENLGAIAVFSKPISCERIRGLLQQSLRKAC